MTASGRTADGAGQHAPMIKLSRELRDSEAIVPGTPELFGEGYRIVVFHKFTLVCCARNTA